MAMFNPDESTADLPAIPYAAWVDTRETLHLYTQLVGKVALSATHQKNHWWNLTLRLDARGVRTNRLHVDGIAFDIAFDFVDHRLVIRTDRGGTGGFELRDGLSVADFDRALHRTLSGLGVDVKLLEKPFGVEHFTTPFPQDTEHASYDADAVHRYWKALAWTADVFEEFSGWYTGKTSPVQLFWHSFDLAVTRFSGKAAPREGADVVSAEAYSHELISFGFWPGDPKVTFPAYYSYAYPQPPGLPESPILPTGATWTNEGAMALLPYENVVEAVEPRRALLTFLESAFQAQAAAARWPVEETMSTWCPTPEQVRAMAKTWLPNG